MSIKDLPKKIKGFTQNRLSGLDCISDDVFLTIIIILVAFGSFGLGRLSKIEGAKTPIRIENPAEITPETFSRAPEGATSNKSDSPQNTPTGAETQLVGSKNGKKYYYPWCGGASRITEANRITFASKSDAEARGYTPSSTCRGL